jgi:hypothetical protein
MSSEQNAGQNHNMKIPNKAKFEYSKTLTHQNCFHEEFISRLNLGNAYHSIQNLLSSHLLPKNIKIKIYMTIIFPALLYGCETLAMRRENTG